MEETVRFIQALAIEADAKILLDENATTPILSALPSQRSASDRIAVMLGPEGGWTDDERGQALNSGWTAYSLGPNVLRAETAAAAALAIVQAAWQQD
jgi:16S rRNA (uracil1498-N3)-methyltransferase